VINVLQVAILEWIEPIFPGGHWTPQIVQLAGAEHPLNPVRCPHPSNLPPKKLKRTINNNNLENMWKKWEK
jgi:hypothetical protein